MRIRITSADIQSGFHDAGVRAGDTLMLHSDAGVLAQLPDGSTEDRMRVFVDAILELLGTEGTLVVPTFSYSFSNNEVYSVNDSPSQVGSLTEFVRKLPRARRSLDPIFSLAAIGARAEEVLAGAADDSFGSDSPFARLHRLKATLAFCGCSFNRATFIHYVEQAAGVPYRFLKSFPGTIIDSDGRTFEREVLFFARKLELGFFTDLTDLKSRMSVQGQIRTGTIGRVEVICAAADDVFRSANALMAENPWGLTTLAHTHTAGNR
jgi:aminoglycoside 3-N-acetyltransferase